MVYRLTLEHRTRERAHEVATAVSQGKWTHDYATIFDEAREMRIPIIDVMPKEIYEAIDLHLKARQQRPCVEFTPVPCTLHRRGLVTVRPERSSRVSRSTVTQES